MSYRHIVFDIDGTLLNSADSDLLALQDTVAQLTGQVIPIPELIFSQGIPGQATLKRLGLDHIPDALPLWVRNVGKYEHTIVLFPGVREMVEILAARGFRLGVVTSRTQEEYARHVSPFGLDPCFSALVLADDTEKHKPDPEPLLKYLELAGTGPAETLYVGDSVHDSQCARAAGVDFALALWGTFDPTIPAQYRPETPGDLTELLGPTP